MFNLDAIRLQFPALQRQHGGRTALFFDGPAASQVPESVIEAIGNYLRNHNANCSGPFATSRDSDASLDAARQAAADFIQIDDPNEIIFGANMTTLTLALSRVLGRTWQAGDEIIVSSLDHDGNVTPWVLAAERAGAKVHHIRFHSENCTLDQDHYRSLLNSRTRLVAIGAAANATGTINPLEEMFAAAQEVGALTFADAVHLAPHRRLNALATHCDFMVCSAYKFFGPHVGILWGKRALLEALQPDKLRPSPNTLPGKWMTGTQNHEGIAGVLAAIDYIASLSGLPDKTPRRTRLDRAFELITTHEQALVTQLLQGLSTLSNFRVWGITVADQLHHRVPTVSLTHRTISARELSQRLAEQGIFCWGGNHYALPFTTAAGLEPAGTLRIGMLHYNTQAEVDRCLKTLAAIDGEE